MGSARLILKTITVVSFALCGSTVAQDEQLTPRKQHAITLQTGLVMAMPVGRLGDLTSFGGGLGGGIGFSPLRKSLPEMEIVLVGEGIALLADPKENGRILIGRGGAELRLHLGDRTTPHLYALAGGGASYTIRSEYRDDPVFTPRATQVGSWGCLGLGAERPKQGMFGLFAEGRMVITSGSTFGNFASIHFGFGLLY